MKKKRWPISLQFLCLSLLLIASWASGASFKLKVSAELANVRTKPDIGSPIILQVPQGAILNSTGKQGEWYLVKAAQEDGSLVSGYVHESLVIDISPAPLKQEKIEKAKEKVDIKKPEEKIPPPPPPAPPKAEQPSKPRAYLSFIGGANYFVVGDLNKGSQGLADYYSDLLATQGEGKISGIHLSSALGVEIAFPLSEQLHLGIGGDYLFGEKESSVNYEKGLVLNTFTSRPKIKAFPLKLSIYLYFNPHFYVKGGLAYYFAEGSYFYRYEKAKSWEEWQGQAKAQGIGFQWGTGREWDFASQAAFFIEVLGQYTRIKGFKGKGTYSDSTTSKTTTEEGNLYFFQGKISGQNSYSLLYIREKIPSESGVSNPRQAELNLSGLTIKAGIRLRF